MAHRADGLNDIFEHDVTVRGTLKANKLDGDADFIKIDGTSSTTAQIPFSYGIVIEPSSDTNDLFLVKDADGNKAFGVNTATNNDTLVYGSLRARDKIEINYTENGYVEFYGDVNTTIGVERNNNGTAFGDFNFGTIRYDASTEHSFSIGAGPADYDYTGIKVKITTDGLILTEETTAGFVKNNSSGLLSGGNTIDISSDTNLSVTSPITLSGDTVGFDTGASFAWSAGHTWMSGLSTYASINSSVVNFQTKTEVEGYDFEIITNAIGGIDPLMFADVSVPQLFIGANSDDTGRGALVYIDATNGSSNDALNIINGGTNRHTTFGFYNYGNTNSFRNIFTANKAKGTIGSPSQVDTNMLVFSIVANEYVNSAFRSTSSFDFSSGGTLSSSSYSSQCSISTTVTGATSRAVRWGIDDQGDVYVATGDHDVQSGVYKIGGTSGFTGTGSYTNFTIQGGIITNAT